MPETLLDAFDAPVVEIIRGKEITFPVLDIDDLLPWTAQLKAQYKAADAKRIAAMPDPFSRYRAEKHSDETTPAIDELRMLSRTAPGGEKVFDLSLTKAGVADPKERRRIIKGIPPWRFDGLAMEVSRLFPPLPPAFLRETPDPNQPAGGSAGGPTGPDSSEPSTGTPENASGE